MLLNQAAFYLRALGRLTEAREPMRAGLENYAKAENWKAAAISASNLSELEVTLGLLGEAVATARRAIEFADQSGDAFQRMSKRTTAADALHQSGQRAEARGLFEQAETLQRERQPEFPLLYSVAGFRYCDLILAPAERAAYRCHLSPRDESGASLSGATSECSKPDEAVESPVPLAEREDYFALAEAERRATEAQRAWREIFTNKPSLLDIALDHLTLARVALYRAVLEGAPASTYTNPHLHEALDGLRKSGDTWMLPRALLTAALHHHFLGDSAAALRCLDEAQQIAERGPMPLYLADVHLHRARLAGSVKDEGRRLKAYPGIDPKAELAKARALIKHHGYGRRAEELADAEAASGSW